MHRRDGGGAAESDQQAAAPAGGSDEHPCLAQAQQLGPGLHPGDGKFGPCMKEHRDDLSDECRQKMRSMMMGARKKLAAQGDDAQGGGESQDSGGDSGGDQ